MPNRSHLNNNVDTLNPIPIILCVLSDAISLGIHGIVKLNHIYYGTNCNWKFT